MRARLRDANRMSGQLNKLAVIFGRKSSNKASRKPRSKTCLPNPVIRSYYCNGFIKQYVRDHLALRTEPASNYVTDYGVRLCCARAGAGGVTTGFGEDVASRVAARALGMEPDCRLVVVTLRRPRASVPCDA